MSLLPIIDHETCTLCLECVRDCPRRILKVVKGRVVVAQDNCLLCAHCYAVCPVAAIDFPRGELKEPRFNSLANSKQRRTPKPIDAGALINAIRARRSVRRYQDRPVPREMLADLVELAATAPSGTNSKLWEFSVVSQPSDMTTLRKEIVGFYRKLNRLSGNPVTRYLAYPIAGDALIKYYRERFARIDVMLRQAAAGHDLFLWDAPAAIVVHAPAAGSTPAEDAHYASYNITLLAHALGLGTCYVGYAREAINRQKSIRKFLGLPPGNTAHAVVLVGFPDVTYARLPLTRQYKVNWVE